VLVWITSGLVLFRWATPPLQPRVVGPYLEWGAWLSSRMSLEGTGRIQILGRNQRPTVPRIQDFDTAADDAGHVGTTLAESLILGRLGLVGLVTPAPHRRLGSHGTTYKQSWLKMPKHCYKVAQSSSSC
jgi:hypothetical protein